MRVALAQLNPTVGDVAGNAELIRDAIEQARQAGAQLVVFPEMTVMGYPPKDLLLKPVAIEQSVEAVEQLAGLCTDIAAIIGYVCPSDRLAGRALYNAAAVCHGGRVVARVIKSLLPAYDVFDEHRYFEPGPGNDIAMISGRKLGISICEDLWNDDDHVSRRLYHINPIKDLAERGADVFINCSASPFVMGKPMYRQRLFSASARRYGLPLLYCNQVGGNDELVFDGHSCAFDATGQLIAQARGFEADLLIVDLPADGQGSPARIEPAMEDLETAYHALVLGLRDYCVKSRFKSIVMGLSGGIDSALSCALAVGALGSENVRGVAMPSRFSSEGSISDARDLASRLNVPFDVVPIEKPHRAMDELLTPLFAGRAPDATEENVQARIRGIILMALSNKFGSLLVTTGNKSELAVGYCTLYGDMAGGLAVLSDVPKTVVWQLSRWINESPRSPLRRQFGRAVIPDNSIHKPPSAELRPDQTDQDSLPPYELLDQIIERYVEREQSTRQIIEALPQADPQEVHRVIRLIDRNEYKRKQAAPGLKITGRAFGFGRRMPIVQRFDPGRTPVAGLAP
jgi:NAD+ synthase (glutamine-hydrolysing)